MSTIYRYENEQDGYCEFDTMAEAVSAANDSRWHSHEKPVVKNGNGKVVHEVDKPKRLAASYFD
jgi:hypothetical protein